MVYSGRDTKLDRDVAIKALPQDVAEDEDRRPAPDIAAIAKLIPDGHSVPIPS